ncbi:MAG TPA: hypothetical protein VFH65_21980 [Mycobacterium sp.]|nr:hypothetical protein [Mycobacterium sp.]
MILTGAFLARYAEVADDSLYVAGGVLGRATVFPPDRSISVYLVALMQVGPDDTGQPNRAKVIFSDWALNDAVLVDQELSFDASGGENRFWVWPLRVNCASGPGRYAFKVTLNGTSFSVPLAVHDAS